MAVIKVTQADKLAARLMETAWYPLTITKCEGPKPSSSGKSVSFYTDFKVNGGEYDGKELSVIFNTGTRNPSVLNNSQYMPSSTMTTTVYAAAHNITLNLVPEEVETNDLIGKQLDCKIEKGIHDGVPMNTIIAFLPLGQGQNQKVPF